MKKYSTLIVIAILVCGLTTSTALAVRDTPNTNSLSKNSIKTFAVPVLFGVEHDALIADFGDSRGGGARSHEGQDMRALRGTPIVSPTKAVVTSVGTGPSAGKFVYTTNPDGESFRYMHMDSIADIKRGDKLSVGDFIGTVGDTGNVPEGIYHLHFEVIDKNNSPTDPLSRMSGTPFTTKQKMSFLEDILDEVDDADEYAEFLISNFRSEFSEAIIEEYSLPDEVEEVLKDSGIEENIELLEKLKALIKTIPTVIPVGVKEGDTGVAVSLLQTYLIFNSDGPAKDALSRASATGYFGPVTKSALVEYQEDNNLTETGVFDLKTQKMMSK